MSSSSTQPPPPLTTTFTPAPSCLQDLYFYTTTFPDITTPSLTQSRHYISLGPPSTDGCFPSGWAATSQFFSPGRCPTGYATNSLTLSIGESVTETRALCCPSGYIPANTENNWFGTNLHATNPCTSNVGDIATTLTVTTITSDSFLTATTAPDVGLNAYGIFIRWQSTDFQTPTSSASSTATNTRISSPTPTPVPPPLEPLLSAGEIAAIVISTLVLISLAVLARWYFAVFKKRNNGRQENDVDGEAWVGGGKSELAATEDVVLLPKEAGGIEILEADGRVVNRLHELSSGNGKQAVINREVHELEARG